MTMSEAKPPPDQPPGEPDLFTPNPEPMPSEHLRRVDGDKGVSLAERVSAGLHRLSYRTALHRIRLRGRFPLKLLAVPADPVPGDTTAGERILRGRLVFAGHNAPAKTVHFADPAAPAAWRDWAHSFVWLRDLAAAAPDRVTAAAVAEPLVARWLADHHDFDASAWRPDLVALRLMFWTAYAPSILSSPDLVYRSAVLNALARWARHLDRAIDRLAEGPRRVTAAAGLIVAALVIPGVESRLIRAEGLFERALSGVVLPDGGTADRSPITQLELVELLLLVQSVYIARGRQPAPAVIAGFERLVPALKSIVMGDGGVGAWHGSATARPARIEHAMARSGIMPRPSRSTSFAGYQRLTAGKALIVVDAAPPPQARAAAAAHAGTLAFEMSDGASRLIVNCGGSALAVPLPGALAAALRTTAAHSTLVLADSNSTRIRPDGALGKGVDEVVVNRQESEEGIWLDLAHDGYVRRFGVRHRRRLFLSASGGDLRGEDLIEPEPGRRLRRRGARAGFDIRFHLGPGIEVTPTADGQAALLKLTDGRVWQVRARGGPLTVDDSVWIDHDGAPRTTRQLVISGMTSAAGEASINWSFKRAGR
jgi:uncharacterized heparinase superfamily protein